MAAATEEKKHSKQGRRKTKRSSFLCSFGGCFGISNKVSNDHHAADRKSVNHQFIPPSPPPPVTKEIHVVEDDEVNTNPSAHRISLNKRSEIITSEKNKNIEEPKNPITKREEKQKSTGADTWRNQRKLSHSVSLPLPLPLPQAAEKKDKKGKEAGEFESTVGAVMISVTLVVMIIWGRVWAVLCTAAWFYFVPRFRAKLEESYATKVRRRGESESDGVDLDSWEHKKKVVLQGLLHRNQNL